MQQGFGKLRPLSEDPGAEQEPVGVGIPASGGTDAFAEAFDGYISTPTVVTEEV
ncbi:MAG: hypothetical protein J2P57_02290 [Acidimicrobiaceae bacterium]|nr:hypothetical protein [Acidimicrobiaceae bacterium]